jgi:tetratricopeptide (TPR) repeat protein
MNALARLRTALLGLAITLSPLPRRIRQRMRGRHPEAARLADRLADTTPGLLAALAAVCLAAAASPRLPPHLERFWLVGAALGFALGVPAAGERRAWRRRLAALPPPLDPIPDLMARAGDDPAVRALASSDRSEARRLARASHGTSEPAVTERAALVAAAVGDVAAARAMALRAATGDPTRWPILMTTAAALSVRERHAAAVALAERAVELSAGAPAAEYTLAQVLAAAGRRREAVAALDRATGRRAAR